jgi:SnoaL-like domain
MMTEGALPDALQALVDKQAIYEVVLRGCRGGDRFDLDLIMSVFHEGARVHNVGGFSGSCEEMRAYLAPIRESFTGAPATFHMLGNHYVELNGDRAVAESYVMVHHWGESSSANPDAETAAQAFADNNYTAGSRYIDALERRAGEWRIVERWAMRDWTWAHRARGTISPGPDHGPPGKLWPADMIYSVTRDWLG